MTHPQESHKWYIYRAAAAQSMLQGNHAAAIECWLSALEEAEDAGDNNPKLTTTLEGLGEALWRSQDYPLASALCRRLLHIYENNLGQDHTDVGIISRNLAMLYHQWGRLEDSLVFYDRALKVFSPVLGMDDPEVQNLIANLAEVLRRLGKHQQAEKLLAHTAQGPYPEEWRKSGGWRAFTQPEATALSEQGTLLEPGDRSRRTGLSGQTVLSE